MAGARGFGVAGALAHDIVRDVARAAEIAGYRTFWVNDTPGGDGLAALAAAAAVTSSIRLGVGVIPLDRQPAERIAVRIDELALPVERLTVGIGAGRAVGGLDRVRAGVVALRALTPAAIVVGALGPKMCRVAGEAADGVLLNWLAPAVVPASAAEVEQAAAAAGRPRPRIDAYVRTALGNAAIARLREEADRYAGFPAYAAHFGRLGADPMETAVAAASPDELQRGLASFDAVLDETIVRAVTAEETLSAYIVLLEAATPGRETAAGSALSDVLR